MFKMECFAKRMMLECRCITRNFSGQGVGEVTWTRALWYRFRPKHQKVFLLDTHKTAFWMENLTQRSTQSAFLSKTRTFFLTFRKGREGLTQVALLWVWLNMHQYPWICLNILENAWINCSDLAKALNIHDHLTFSTGFWRCLWSWISHGSEYGMVVYARVTQSSKYVLLWLHMPQYVWPWLNIAECPWVCLKTL